MSVCGLANPANCVNCEIAEVAVRQQIGQNVVAVLVPGTGWRLRVVAQLPL